MNPELPRRPMIITFALAPVLACVLLATSPQIEDAAPANAYVQWVGHDSKNPDAGFSLILDEVSWHALWEAHTGTRNPQVPPTRHSTPTIDFTQCMVVAYFRGPTTNHDGELLSSASIAKDLVRLRFETSTFQTSGVDDRGGAVDTHPFGIWVLPRTNTPIVIEQRRTGLKDDPVRWDEVHRFPGR